MPYLKGFCFEKCYSLSQFFNKNACQFMDKKKSGMWQKVASFNLKTDLDYHIIRNFFFLRQFLYRLLIQQHFDFLWGRLFRCWYMAAKSYSWKSVNRFPDNKRFFLVFFFFFLYPIFVLCNICYRQIKKQGKMLWYTGNLEKFDLFNAFIQLSLYDLGSIVHC